jgi:hypothetical protein
VTLLAVHPINPRASRHLAEKPFLQRRLKTRPHGLDMFSRPMKNLPTMA